MNRQDYTPGTEPMRPIAIAAAISTTIYVVMAAVVLVAIGAL